MSHQSKPRLCKPYLTAEPRLCYEYGKWIFHCFSLNLSTSRKYDSVINDPCTDLEHGSRPNLSKLPDHKPSLIESHEPVIDKNVPVVSASEPSSSTRPARNTRPPDRLQYSKLGGG